MILMNLQYREICYSEVDNAYYFLLSHCLPSKEKETNPSKEKETNSWFLIKLSSLVN